ncbi:phage tail protein [Sphingomonas profundi]|uniref:phage tail protein n=1 Tax=Alterirhizorhabdus profundi TaxID=2681549 RepID=UPI0012E788D8|nr:phage tail protein [Sphingomonas profundi]
MATLVLTTIGTVIGGPIGGAIGAVLGQQVDQRLLGPRRQGARLGALTVQTSAYGQPIPKLFGTLRVAGTVIWATDLREDRSTSGGGKGKPKTTSYSYSASFAVALSGRPIRAVHRIWADGKLLRGAAGDWKSETGFRLHPGDEAQAIDPLIAAAEGAAGTPAYRGMAYAVFEDMQLADFGNRIPSLTFEVEADSAPVPLGTIAGLLSDGAVAGPTAATLGGYAASGDSVRGAIETIARAIPLSLRDDGTRLLIGDTVPAAMPIAADELGTADGEARAERRRVDRAAAGTLPDEVTITYYEPERDYQAGLQRARRGGGPGRRVEAIELAAAMAAGAAKAVAERRLADAWDARATAKATLPWRRLDLRPGDTITAQDGRVWRIGGWTLENMVLTLTLRATAERDLSAIVAQPGRATAGADAVHGPTSLALLNLPPVDDGAAGPRLWLAAAGVSPGWRRAAVIASTDGGASWQEIGATAAPAIMGDALTVLPPDDTALFDARSFVEVALLNEAMTLLSRDCDALVDGANLAMIGDELIQFGQADAIGGGRWRLSGLIRGRRGTEAAMSGHAVGDRFVLVTADTLLPIEVPPDRIGANVRVIATGVADAAGVESGAIATGRALRPPCPVHLTAAPLPGGGLRLSWVRRSRVGWAWTDGGDVLLGEETERYRVTITPNAGAARTVEVALPGCDYDAAAIAADGAGAADRFAVSVVQLGNHGATPDAARATFNPMGGRL